MKKTSLMKVLVIGLILMLTISIGTFTGSVYAATSDDDYGDITDDYLLEQDEEENTNKNSNKNTNNTNKNTNNANKNTNNSNKNSNNSNKTNNTNLYGNENNLPDTGIEDSMPTVLLIVVFGISAVYAYKKISDYRNL